MTANATVIIPAPPKEAPQYCVTNLTSAPGKSQTYEFYGLPDVNN